MAPDYESRPHDFPVSLEKGERHQPEGEVTGVTSVGAEG
jgi:hypothetical protein